MARAVERFLENVVGTPVKVAQHGVFPLPQGKLHVIFRSDRLPPFSGIADAVTKLAFQHILVDCFTRHPQLDMRDAVRLLMVQSLEQAPDI